MNNATEVSETAKLELEILHHNAGLVQFADQKAATLIVIDSIFIASAAATGTPPAIAAFACAALSLLFCLAVIAARRDGEGRDPRSLVYFGDIAEQKSWRAYLATLRTQPHESLEEGVAASIYRTSRIARRKFACYAWALGLTIAAAPLWLAGFLIRG